MPKSKPDQVINYRIELQEHERELLDMVAASIMVENLSKSFGNVLAPLTQCSVAGAGIAFMIWELIAIGSPEKEGVLERLFNLGSQAGEWSWDQSLGKEDEEGESYWAGVKRRWHEQGGWDGFRRSFGN